MSHVPHEIAEEFPGDADRIRALKMEDAHFAGLLEAYHEINRAVHRAETGVEACSEATEADMRRERMRLKDQIAAVLAKV